MIDTGWTINDVYHLAEEYLGNVHVKVMDLGFIYWIIKLSATYDIDLVEGLSWPTNLICFTPYR